MAYRQTDRQQMWLLPESIENYVTSQDPVRAYDAFIEALDFNSLGIEINPYKVGCPQYNPRVMLKILVYGYSYGIRSSRKLERALHHNLSFIWLAGGLKPDHKTIARFRRDNRDALKRVLKQCARICIELGLIAGNTLFVDGSKFRGNVSLDNLWTADRCERYLAKIDKRIDEIIAECEVVDESEAGDESLIKLQNELENKEKLKTKVESVMEKLTKEGIKRHNTTDPESAPMRGRQGSHAGYNAQIVVDDSHGLIVESDVVNENNDLGQFAKQIEKANETLEKPCETACADAGYSNADELERIDSQDIEVIVPSSRQASGKEPGAFDKTRFHYDADDDCYICPEGQRLPCRLVDRRRKRREYYTRRSVCLNCKNYGVCTESKTTGRKIIRYDNESVRERLATQYKTPTSQAIYNRRKEKVELPFGHIKRNLGVDAFLLRGLTGVRAEMSILGSCFNIRRLITIFGVSGLVAKLSAL